MKKGKHDMEQTAAKLSCGMIALKSVGTLPIVAGEVAVTVSDMDLRRPKLAVKPASAEPKEGLPRGTDKRTPFNLDVTVFPRKDGEAVKVTVTIIDPDVYFQDAPMAVMAGDADSATALLAGEWAANSISFYVLANGVKHVIYNLGVVMKQMRGGYENLTPIFIDPGIKNDG